MIKMINLTISQVIDNYYIIKCSQTLLEAEGYGLQKVARDLNKKDKDRDRQNALQSSHSCTYTTAGSTTRFV